jgi:glutamate racemase
MSGPLNGTTSGPTIGVFDSGFGGLTVLRALLPLIPGAHYIYLGDTARLPYGAKSQSTIARYAVESARFLAAQGAEHIMIACNTATALALPEICSSVPVLVTGVIEPVVRRAGRIQNGADTLILATAATVESNSYKKRCLQHGLRPTEKACPLLVPLIEEGWIDHAVTREVVRIYLNEALQICTPRLVVLGCTHYPLIAPLIGQVLRELGSQAEIIDSAQASALEVAKFYSEDPHPLRTSNATFTCYATDSVEKFRRLGSRFLGQTIPQVHLLDLGG